MGEISNLLEVFGALIAVDLSPPSNLKISSNGGRLCGEAYRCNGGGEGYLLWELHHGNVMGLYSVNAEVVA